MIESPAARFENIRLKTGPRLHYAECGDPRWRVRRVPSRVARLVVLVQPGPAAFAREPSRGGRRPARVRRLGSSAIRLCDSRNGGGRHRLSRCPPDQPRDAGRPFVRQLRRPAGSDRATAAGHRSGVDWHRFRGVEPVTRDLQNVLRDLPDPIPVEFARDFQASTVYRPVPPEFFERIIAESLKLPPRLWRLAIDGLVEYDDARLRIEAPRSCSRAIATRSSRERIRTASWRRYGHAVDGTRKRPLPELGAAGAGDDRCCGPDTSPLNLRAAADSRRPPRRPFECPLSGFGTDAEQHKRQASQVSQHALGPDR